MKFAFIVVLSMVAESYCNQYKLPLSLSVFYESKCPDSTSFIVDQLGSAASALQDYVKFQLVPFGKAKSIGNGSGGFECQHGPSECLGNLVQDCALNLMEETLRSDIQKIRYVTCEMKTQAGTIGDLRCVKEAGLEADIVQQCIKSDQGIKLQLESERLTNRFKPKFIPTITVNEVFDQRLQDEGLEHLVTSLCNLLPNVRPCASQPPHALRLY